MPASASAEPSRAELRSAPPPTTRLQRDLSCSGRPGLKRSVQALCLRGSAVTAPGSCTRCAALFSHTSDVFWFREIRRSKINRGSWETKGATSAVIKDVIKDFRRANRGGGSFQMLYMCKSANAIL